jgi:arabinofuranosyltransferase
VYPPASPAGATSELSASTRRFVFAALFLLFTYVFLVNQWMGDDAHITFRSVWNFVRGYGMTYNPDERVQAFTHPLWMLLISAVHLVTREFYFSVTILSWVLDVAAGWVLLRRARTLAGATLVVLWAISSKALIDYTSSGLEYPLSYFLIALFLYALLVTSLPSGADAA